MSHPFAEIDATGWEPAGAEQIGSKTKEWLFEPSTSVRWLWKPRTFNTMHDGGRYPKGDDWAEKVATEAARSLGIPCATVELAHRGDEVGVLSRSFTDRAGEDELELVLGNVLLGAVIDGYHPSTQRGGTGYTVESVVSVLRDARPPSEATPFRTAADWFFAYLALDAWIGNSDRHHQNWGVLREPSGGTSTLAPTYDHASSLGYLLSDEARERRLTSNDSQHTVASYARRTETPFEGRLHPVSVAEQASAHASTAVVQALVQSVETNLAIISDSLARVPNNRISDEAREFAIQLAALNASEMLLHLGRTL